MSEVIRREASGPVVHDRVYPEIPKDPVYPEMPGDPNGFRLSSCSRTMEMMRENLRLDMKKRDSAMKRHSRLRLANGFSSAGSAALSASGIGVSATGVGAIVGVPLIGVGALLGFTSLVTLALDKEAVRKLTKYEKLISIGQAKLGSIREMINKALSDESISEEESRKMNGERSDYENQRSEVLKGRKNSKSSDEGLGRARSLRGLTEDLLKAIQDSR